MSESTYSTSNYLSCTIMRWNRKAHTLICQEHRSYHSESSSFCEQQNMNVSTSSLSLPDIQLQFREEDNSRLVAFLESWQPCPSPIDKIIPYTHILIAFAQSFIYNPGKNICSTTCEIYQPQVCTDDDSNDNPNSTLVSRWQSLGKKVMVSFGGAGMGTKLIGENYNNCWRYCFGKETEVVERLVEIVINMGLDGVDIGYSDTVTEEAAKFLNEVTSGLRESMPVGSLISHTVVNAPEIAPGQPYYEKILKVSGKSLDWLGSEFIDDYTRLDFDEVEGEVKMAVNGNDTSSNNSAFTLVKTADENSSGAISHYVDIVDGIFEGDPTKVVFGFCLGACWMTGTNRDGAKASSILTAVAKTYPCFGGAYFWNAKDDLHGLWSTSVRDTLNDLSLTGCPLPPSELPVITPSNSTDTFTLSPTSVSITSAEPSEEVTSHTHHFFLTSYCFIFIGFVNIFVLCECIL